MCSRACRVICHHDPRLTCVIVLILFATLGGCCVYCGPRWTIHLHVCYPYKIRSLFLLPRPIEVDVQLGFGPQQLSTFDVTFAPEPFWFVQPSRGGWRVVCPRRCMEMGSASFDIQCPACTHMLVCGMGLIIPKRQRPEPEVRRDFEATLMARRMTHPTPGPRATRDPYLRDEQNHVVALPNCSGGRNVAEDTDKLDEARDIMNGGSSGGGNGSSNGAKAAATSELASGNGLTLPPSGHGALIPPPLPPGHATTVTRQAPPPQSGHATTVVRQPPWKTLRPKQPEIPPPSKLLMLHNIHNMQPKMEAVDEAGLVELPRARRRRRGSKAYH